MAYRLVLTHGAERDLDDIYRYIESRDGTARADTLVVELLDVCNGIVTFPERNNVPKELRQFGVLNYREAHCGPYRIVCRIAGSQITVYCIVDGRRDMQSLLRRRLLL